jgi:hypothetical protein
MTYLRLKDEHPVIRMHDGSFVISTGNGESVQLGRAFGPLALHLHEGVSELEWSALVRTNPHLPQLEIALTELGFIEMASRRRGTIVGGCREPDAIKARNTWYVDVALVALAVAATTAGIRISNSGAEVMPGWGWLLLPPCIYLTAFAHEIGHYIAARLLGFPASIRMWRRGAFRPRCVFVSSQLVPSTLARRLTLTAGPFCDSGLALILCLLQSAGNDHPAIRLASLCATLSLMCNVWPGALTDCGKSLSFVGSRQVRRLMLCAYRSVSLALLIICVYLTASLLGLSGQ